MPRLLFFLPCEKIITSQENALSLINVIENVNLKVPLGIEANLKEKPIIPISWYVMAVFRWGLDDVGKQYEQRVEFILPDGQIFTDAVTPFSTQGNEQHVRNLLIIGGFPVTIAGLASLKLYLRLINEPDWKEIAEYPIQINRQ